MAFSDYQTTFHGPQTVTLWPDTNTPQIDINGALLSNDFLPNALQAPPYTGSTELFPDDPFSSCSTSSTLCRFHRTLPWWSIFNMSKVWTTYSWQLAPCLPVSLADGTTKISTFKGPTESYFATDEGQRSILGLTNIYFMGKLLYHLIVCRFYNNDQWLTIVECMFLLYQPIRNVTYKITHVLCTILLYHPIFYNINHFEPCSAGHATVSRRQWYPVAYWS